MGKAHSQPSTPTRAPSDPAPDLARARLPDPEPTRVPPDPAQDPTPTRVPPDPAPDPAPTPVPSDPAPTRLADLVPFRPMTRFYRWVCGPDTWRVHRNCAHCGWMNQKMVRTDVRMPTVCFNTGGLPNTLHCQALTHQVTQVGLVRMLTECLDLATLLDERHRLDATAMCCFLTFGKNKRVYRYGEYEHLHCWLGIGPEDMACGGMETSPELTRVFGPRPVVEVLANKNLMRHPYPSDTLVYHQAINRPGQLLVPGELYRIIRHGFRAASGVNFAFGRHQMCLFVTMERGVPTRLTLVAILSGR